MAEGVDQDVASVADVEVAGDVAADLRVAAAVGDQEGEGQQFAGAQVDPAAGVVVTEAVRGEPALEVLLVGGGGRASR